jgi:O-Antigen ligase
MAYILIGYMWLFIHRPFEVWEILSTIRLERVYMLFALLAWMCYGGRRWISSSLHAAYGAFTVAMLVCWIVSPWIGREYSQILIENYLKQCVFYVLLVTSVSTEQDLKNICVGFIGSVGLYLAHSFREFKAGRHEYRMGIARMMGVDTSLGDPNSFAATLVYALPLVVAVWFCTTDRRVRALLVGYWGLSVYSIISTGSRTALAGVVLWCGALVFRSRHRLRVLLALLVISPLVWGMMPQEKRLRFYTMIDPSVGPANAQGSAESRAEGFLIGLRLLAANPLTGCGPGGWRPSSGSPIESHNLYGQVMGEMGVLGLATFIPLVVLILSNARWITKTYKQHPEWNKDFLYYLGDAVGTAILLMLFMGYGGHNLFRFNWQWYGGFLIIARYCVEQRIDRLEKARLLGLSD